MNPTQCPFPNSQPVLKLARRASSTTGDSGATMAPFAAAMQRDLTADLAALQERETNLREYEARLRAWQDELDARVGQPATGLTAAPFLRAPSETSPGADAVLATSWEKFHRARALLEAEQKQVRDDRMMLREAETNVRTREAALEAREARIAAREQELAGAVEGSGASAPEAVPEEKPLSTLQRLTQAPWAVFKSAK